MAELDCITVCERCWVPVEAGELWCPECGGAVRAYFPFLLLPSVRTLSAKGWSVKGWSRGGGTNDPTVYLSFFKLAPPVVPNRKEEFGGPVQAVFSGYGSPGVSVWARTWLGAFRMMLGFAEEAPRLSLPFWAEACGKCEGQGGDWMFGRCKCPAGGGWRRFADGVPDKCAYAAEQVLTRDERVSIMRGVFEGRPVSQRALSRRV